MKYQYTGDLPIIRIALYHAGHEITIPAVVDSGAMVSVLPYDTGIELGFVWEEQTVPVKLGGTCQGVPAFGVLVQGFRQFISPVS